VYPIVTRFVVHWEGLTEEMEMDRIYWKIGIKSDSERKKRRGEGGKRWKEKWAEREREGETDECGERRESRIQ